MIVQGFKVQPSEKKITYELWEKTAMTHNIQYNIQIFLGPHNVDSMNKVFTLKLSGFRSPAYN